MPSIPKPETGRGALLELIIIVALAIGLALVIQAFLVKPFQIPSGSMEPTLDIGQRVLVNRFLFHFEDPEVGDIVVFHPPVGAEQGNVCGGSGAAPPEGQVCAQPTPDRADVNFIKRIVAGPGDRIRIEDGRVVLNGREQREPFARLDACGGGECDFPEEITVPPDHYFMMGDNRGASDDSRFWGPVPREWIIGGAFATYWPPRKIGLL